MSLRLRFVIAAMVLLLSGIIPIGWYAISAIDRSISVWHDAEVRTALQDAVVAVDDTSVRGDLNDALVRYQQLGALQRPMERTIIVVGVGVALVTILLAVVIALVLATQFTRPLRSVSGAARIIADEGDLRHTVPPARIPEISVLVDSFNDMVRSLRDSRAALTRAERRAAWQDIARTIAHEIKNPLTPMRLTTERLRERFTDNRDRFDKGFMRSTEMILTEIDRLERLASGFSSFAKMPAPILRPLDLREVALEVGELLEAQAGRELRVDVPGDVVPVMGDREQLEQAVLNLAKNGLEAVDPEDGRVAISLSVDAGRAVLIVSDDGPGISANVLDMIFQPYVSTKSGGSGIGLAVVERVIIDHHGRVAAENIEPTGAKFEISVPLTREPIVDEESDPNGHTPARGGILHVAPGSSGAPGSSRAPGSGAREEE